MTAPANITKITASSGPALLDAHRTAGYNSGTAEHLYGRTASAASNNPRMLTGAEMRECIGLSGAYAPWSEEGPAYVPVGTELEVAASMRSINSSMNSKVFTEAEIGEMANAAFGLPVPPPPSE